MLRTLVCIASILSIANAYVFTVTSKPGVECGGPLGSTCRCFNTDPPNVGTEIRATIGGLTYYFRPGECGRFLRIESMVARVAILQNDGQWSASLNVSLAEIFVYSQIGPPAQYPYVQVAAIFDACINPYSTVTSPPLPECPPRAAAGVAAPNLWSSSVRRTPTTRSSA